ncbi:YeeE/YedE family protein [Alkanindiges sp. WGS2144]|uniref:YeeE/YedE family protein n=1 Tax=Alkanindiges sp. WGS2144 TaxID=3366808 RepID=UPI003750E97F
MHGFTLALIGGLVLGIAVSGYLLVYGRVAGVSGMVAQLFNVKANINSPAIWFLGGLVIIPIFYQLFFQPEIIIHSSPLVLMIAGLLVGFGTQMGSGCTSGHGICGISRWSPRSIAATLSFMLAGFITVYLARHVFGL